MRHRLVMALFGLALFASAAAAQQAPDAEKMKANYEEKIKKDFVKKIEWVQSLDTAKKKAAQDSKLIFAYFSRSYSP